MQPEALDFDRLGHKGRLLGNCRLPWENCRFDWLIEILDVDRVASTSCFGHARFVVTSEAIGGVRWILGIHQPNAVLRSAYASSINSRTPSRSASSMERILT